MKPFAALVVSILLAGCVTVSGPPAFAPVEPGNLGQLKAELRTYHDNGAYERALAAVIQRAQTYITMRAPQVARPAIVLDIDETSLSNWPQMLANDFGYFSGGTCDDLPRGPCGAVAWERSARAPAIGPTLDLYRAARAANVAVFFITGRREPQRAGTEANLRAAGYTEWTRVVLRAPDSHGGAVDYKSAQRAAIEAEGYTIIANLGDQQSDLDGGHAERTYKLPNPFYFIP